MTIKTLLIANRGEIACRIMRSARDMGIRTVAVHSDADAGAAHVRMADHAIAIGPAAARDSYLVGPRIIAAALDSGADAIHPGYGFLSENAEFAQSVMDAGLIWVGPPPAAIRAMGRKDAAKARMMDAGVPVTPGYLGADQSPETLFAQAQAIGFPVLIKAVAGGGGKGMRRVDAPGDFLDALASCQREAASSFGDSNVLLEKYILAPRHIEVQVFGDTHGALVHLFERDCSLQRRHQKVIEEAPAPGMDDATRAALCAAAVRAAAAVDYVGAGTVEFIADASEGLRADRIWFMEMNTRLQVEHPVTEAITGVDLVAWQLRVAGGEPLPLRQDQLAIHGHAIEARLYAEDAARGFLPATGRVDVFAFTGLRVDSAVSAGDTITPHYDPMIAKLIAHAPTRDKTLAQLRNGLAAGDVGPVTTNRGFLYRLLGDDDVAAARLDTGLIARHLDDLAPVPMLSAAGQAQAAATLIGGPGDGPWAALSGLRLNGAPHTQMRMEDQHGRLYTVEVAQGQGAPRPAAIIHEAGESHRLTIARPRGIKGGTGHDAHGDGAIRAPMPGLVIASFAAQGQTVTKGQKLFVLEAMKMEHTMTAPFDGTITAWHVEAGMQVQVDALLARVEA